jgi:predicted class III extradiol MEMO1 family dioxygenase
MYTMLHLLDAKHGKLLKYDRSLDRQTQSSVSFASVAFY